MKSKLSQTSLATFATITLVSMSGCFLDDTAQMNQTTTAMNNTMGTMASTTAGMATTTTGMANTTTDLDTKTTAMAATTTGLSNKTDVMVGKMSAMDATGRKAGAADLRNKALAAMDKATSQDMKIAEAATYFNSFEFQLLEPTEMSNNALVNDLYDEAIADFFHDMPDYLPSAYDRGNASPSSTNNKMMNLYALAATMHYENYIQNQTLIALYPNDPVQQSKAAVTMLSLVKAALQSKSDPNEPLWMHEARTHLDDAVYMLQIRSNFTAALALAKVSDVQKKGFLGIPGLVTKLGMLLGGWNAKTNVISDELLDDCTTWLTESNDERIFLTQTLKTSAMIDGKLLKIYKDMRFPQGKKPADPKEAVIRGALLDAFKHQVSRFATQSVQP